MNPQLVITADGSPTLYIDAWQEHYHSMHGAVQESQHVFIHAGLLPMLEKREHIHLLEIGLGTGFNALLSLHTALQHKKSIHYTALEPYPISAAILSHFEPMHLTSLQSGADYFTALHAAAWETMVNMHPQFQFVKSKTKVQEFSGEACADLIYFDAFSPRVQPDMWTLSIFSAMFTALNPGGMLVTYCAKGEVRRTMTQCGFQVERLPGPPGKREMLRATKL